MLFEKISRSTYKRRLVSKLWAEYKAARQDLDNSID